MTDISDPDKLGLEERIMDKMSEEADRQRMDSVERAKLDSLMEILKRKDRDKLNEIDEHLDELLILSDNARRWLLRFAYMGLVVSLFYIVAGAFLFIKKPYSPNVALLVLGIGIVFSLVQSTIMFTQGGMNLTTLLRGTTHIFALIFDVIMLIVVAVSNKEAYLNAKRI